MLLSKENKTNIPKRRGQQRELFAMQIPSLLTQVQTIPGS